MADEPRPTAGPLVQTMADVEGNVEEMNLWRREEETVNLYIQFFNGNGIASSNLFMQINK